MDTGYTIAKYINKYKYDNKYEMINDVALGLWVYGEEGNGFGCPKNAFFTPDPVDNIRKLHTAGKKNGLIWASSDLNPGKFQLSDCFRFHII